MSTPVDYKLHMYNVIPKATTKNTIQRDTLQIKKTLQINQNVILNNVQVTHRKKKIEGTENKK